MWKVFPMLGLLKLLFSAFSALLLVVLVLLLPAGSANGGFGWNSFGDAFGFVVPVMFVFLGIVIILGKWGWRLLWKAPYIGALLHEKVCPDLNGKWNGLITSTFLNDDGQPSSKAVTLNIKADLFGFDINLNSDDGYQSSRVVQCDLYKDNRTKHFYLSYIYEAQVPDPKEGDEVSFQGAARLQVKISESGDTALDGTYWTNRMWKKKMNTAGSLVASRATE